MKQKKQQIIISTFLSEFCHMLLNPHRSLVSNSLRSWVLDRFFIVIFFFLIFPSTLKELLKTKWDTWKKCNHSILGKMVFKTLNFTFCLLFIGFVQDEEFHYNALIIKTTCKSWARTKRNILKKFLKVRFMNFLFDWKLFLILI